MLTERESLHIQSPGIIRLVSVPRKIRKSARSFPVPRCGAGVSRVGVAGDPAAKRGGSRSGGAAYKKAVPGA
jgi:hypothetical protein